MTYSPNAGMKEDTSKGSADKKSQVDIYTLIDDIILEHDLDTGSTTWKNVCNSPFDLRPNSSLADWRALIHPNDLEETLSSAQEALCGDDQQWSRTYWLKDLNNTYQLIQDRRIIKRYENGRPSSVLAVLKVIPQEQQLRNRLDRSFDLACIGRWELDLLSGELYWSDITKKIHNKPLHYIPNIEEAIYFYKEGEHRDQIQSSIQNVLDGHIDTWNLEAILVTATGQEKWVRAFGQAEKIRGKIVRLFGSLQDISEQKETELIIQHAKKRYQLAAKAGTIGIWEWDFSRKRIHLDEVMYDLYGFSPEDRNRPLSTLESRLHPEDLSNARRELEEAIQNGGNYQSTFRICLPPDRSLRHIKAFGDIVFDESGHPKTMIGLNMDITQEVEQTRNLRQANAEKEEILNSISDGFISIDDNRQMTYCNKAAKTIFNSLQDWEDQNWFDITFRKQGHVWKKLEQCLSQKVTTWSKAYYEETETWLYILFYPKEEGAVCFFRDISDVEEYAQIITTQYQKLKKIAWAQSHELRAPLTNILGLVNLLREAYTGDNQEIHTFLDMLSESSVNLDAIIHKMILETDHIP
jgi:PAS domain-containing protein